MERSIALACCAIGALTAASPTSRIKIFFFIFILTSNFENYSAFLSVFLYCPARNEKSEGYCLESFGAFSDKFFGFRAAALPYLNGRGIAARLPER
jgi:hypothetical protein